MSDNKTNKYVYLSTMIGATFMMLLRICDKGSILSAILVIAGMTALIYSLRHSVLKSEYISIAGIMALTYAVRFYGYTGDPATDLILGPLVGFIMFLLMGFERLLKKFEDSFWYTLIFPVMYLLFMYFTEIVKINMPFRLDPYLSGMQVLCQITVLFGIYSLDFLIAWTASVLVFFVDHMVPGAAYKSSGVRDDDGRKENKIYRQCLILFLAYLSVLGSFMCYGLVHMYRMTASEKAKSDTVRVACATGPYCGTLSEGYTEFTMEESMTSFSGIVQDAAEQNAEILFFSEEAYCITDENEDDFIEAAKELAANNNMHLLLAYEVDDTDGSENGKSINKLCWISNEGQTLYEYTKHCIIPFIETAEYVRGDKNIESFEIQVHGKTLKVATAICYDSDFDFFMSHMGKNLDMLLLPTWDWKVIAEEHFSVARLRAIQSETTLVRCVYDGWSAVIDSAGNVLARENTNDIGYGKVFVYDVPIK